MDSPHTTRLESAALATLAAQQFTSTATRQRATVNFKGLRLPQAPMRAHYSSVSYTHLTLPTKRIV